MQSSSFQSPGIIASNPAIVFPKHLAFFLEQNRKKSGPISSCLNWFCAFLLSESVCFPVELEEMDNELSKVNERAALNIVKCLKDKSGGLRGFGSARQIVAKQRE